MKINHTKNLLLFLFLFFFTLCQPLSAENRIKTGMKFPDITLEGKDCTDRAAYLGVENHDLDLELSEIPAKLIVLEFFAVTCPVCQAQAPVANKIYKIINRNPDLKKDVKMISIGVGAHENEVDAYRKQYAVKFPIFIDPYANSKKRHGIGLIPYTLVINADRDVLYAHLGVIENQDEFITRLCEFNSRK